MFRIVFVILLITPSFAAANPASLAHLGTGLCRVDSISSVRGLHESIARVIGHNVITPRAMKVTVATAHLTAPHDQQFLAQLSPIDERRNALPIDLSFSTLLGTGMDVTNHTLSPVMVPRTLGGVSASAIPVRWEDNKVALTLTDDGILDTFAFKPDSSLYVPAPGRRYRAEIVAPGKFEWEQAEFYVYENGPAGLVLELQSRGLPAEPSALFRYDAAKRAWVGNPGNRGEVQVRLLEVTRP